MKDDLCYDKDAVIHKLRLTLDRIENYLDSYIAEHERSNQTYSELYEDSRGCLENIHKEVLGAGQCVNKT